MESSGPVQKRSWGRLTAIALSMVMLAVVLRRLDPHALWETLRHARIGWFLGANLAFVTTFCVAAARWHLMLRINRSAVHFGATLRLVMIGHFFNTLLFGPAGGDFAKAGLYSRWFGFGVAPILSTCALDRLAGGVGFLLFALLAPLLALTGGRPTTPLHLPSPSRLLVGIGAVLVTVLAVALWRRKKRSGPASRVARFVDSFRANAGQVLANPRVGFSAVFFSFLTHIGMSSLLLFCLQSVATTPFSTLELLWVFPVITAVTTIPVTFAGTGMREGAAMVLLGMYGIKPADAVASALLVFIVYLLWAAFGAVWLWRTSRHVASIRNHPAATLSVVIPTFNEAAAIPETIRHLRAVPEIRDIIVADGGSSDGTRERAESLGCRVVACARGRGEQLHAGAAAATGDVIVLVHADTWLPSDAGVAVVNCLRDPEIVGGGFWKIFQEPTPLLRGSRLKCAIRFWLGGRVMGDQAMFIRRDALERIGGVPRVALMEEFELCRRLRGVGKLALAGATVRTSARRFARLGAVRTYLRMARVTFQYYLGTPPERLRGIYERE
jgi:rSAM/selenodomain-associated transferase 2